MAVLEIDGDTALVSPVRRQRRVGALFVCAVGWIALIGLAAIFADLLPIASPTDMDLLAKRAPGTSPGARFFFARGCLTVFHFYTSLLQTHCAGV